MKPLQKLMSVGLLLTLISGLFAPSMQQVNAAKKDGLLNSESKVISEKTTESGTETHLKLAEFGDTTMDVKIDDSKDRVVVKTEQDGHKHKSVADKTTNKITTTSNDSNDIQTDNVSDIFKEDTSQEANEENNFIEEPDTPDQADNAHLAGAPKGYNFNIKSYNGGIGEWGYLYSKKTNTSYGKVYIMDDLDAKTSVSILIAGAISAGLGLATAGVSVAVEAALASMGISVVAGAITEAIYGQSLRVKKIDWSYVGKSHNKVGLRTEEKRAYFKIKNHKYKFLKILSGDYRSKPDLAEDAAYNVYIQ